MEEKFCKALNNALSFRIPGSSKALTFNPCCLYDKYIPFHPTLFQKTRKQFIETKTFLPECSKCELKEKTHGMSLRTMTNSQIPDDIGNEIYKLEIVLDTTCNAACIQCGAAQSSLWRKEINNDKKIYHIQSETDINKKIEEITKVVDLSNVKLIHFWGGEPLLTDTHTKFLSLFKNYRDMEISYTTNGSVFPDDSVLNLWQNFKKIKIGLSIDGIKDKFHYIRWPLKWEKVSKNLILFNNETPDNIFYHINCCILPINAYYVDELGNWLAENFYKRKNGSNIGYNFIRGEGVLDIACTPMNLRELIWKKMPEDHPISKVLKEVPVKDYKNMIDHLDYWDPRRNLNWRETFKEVAEYFS